MNAPDPAACPTCSDTDYALSCECRQGCGHALCLGTEAASESPVTIARPYAPEVAPFSGASLTGPVPDVTWPEQDPDRKALSCGPCGEKFATDPSAPFTSPLLAAAITEAATAAGWQQDGETWTCTVCLAKAAAGPAPEPAPDAPESEPEPVPDTDPLDQSLAVLAAFDARVPGFWAETNQGNNTVGHKTWLRTNDGKHNLAAIFDRTPDLRTDPEADLRRYEAELAERKDAAHREHLERLARLREGDHARHAAAETEVAA